MGCVALSHAHGVCGSQSCLWGDALNHAYGVCGCLSHMCDHGGIHSISERCGLSSRNHGGSWRHCLELLEMMMS